MIKLIIDKLLKISKKFIFFNFYDKIIIKKM